MRKVLSMLLAATLVFSMTGCGSKKAEQYQEALDHAQAGEYTEAIECLEALGNYEDAPEKLAEIKYEYASELLLNGQAANAETVFESLGTYKDAQDQMNYCRLAQGFAAIDNVDYDEAVSIFNTVEGTYQKDAEKAIESIDCIYAAEEVTAMLQEEYAAPLPSSYLSLFALDYSCDFYYDVPSYAYHFNIYFPEGMSSIVSALSLGEESLSSVAQDTESDGKEIDIYKMFCDRGFPNITVYVEYFEYDGTLINSFSYSLEQYEADRETEIREKEEAQAKADEVIRNYTLITNNELFVDDQGAVNPEYNEKAIRMEHLKIISSIENTDGTMDSDMALWLSSGMGGVISLKLRDEYGARRISEEGLEYINIYGILHAEPNPYHPEMSSIDILDGGVYFTDN